MKIWITRRSAFSLQVGGLDRLNVWFDEPCYYYKKYKPYEDCPYSSQDEQGLKLYGIRDDGWDYSGGSMNAPIPYSKLFGYADTGNYTEDTLTNWVWDKLTEHFDNEPFERWHVIERENPFKYHIKNFLLYVEIDSIHVSVKTAPNIKYGSVPNNLEE